ncbi:iron-hydroxamate ABC transporter substrate-binding protein [Bacillus salacetis]|uniref:Iron-hydroxamate ABC transporter substrate-binding protein n=1 Tax=Bacillus salacetis TaxID=2315464 RepID=A0A3A1QPM2_9BACI|nr:iron-hydroxamate ABC transporter substrate-binding protein [Bacillus salacetis]RIW29032.1 iron-hydroxamate ABC transporter substrate-binding protein [Bacillus salacetis]
MKKLILPFLLLAALLLSACGNNTENNSSSGESDNKEKESETITYESENGPVEVPADPQRVIVLSSFAGNVMALDVDLVGVDSWSKMNPRFEERLEGVEEVTDESLEKIIELDPDLIIGLSNIKNVDKLKEIAPTVTFTYGKVDYLTQHVEIGKLLNKEEEAQKWVDDFKSRAKAAGEEIKGKIGEDTTVSVLENFNKQIYVYGDNWGRGTEILYQEMGLKMPEKVKESALEPGYYAVSLEVLPEFAGDYVVLSRDPDQDNSFMETDTYKNIPAVKNNQVIEVNMMEFYFNDPLTLEHQLETFKEAF